MWNDAKIEIMGIQAAGRFVMRPRDLCLPDRQLYRSDSISNDPALQIEGHDTQIANMNANAKINPAVAPSTTK